MSITCKQPQCSDILLHHPVLDLTLRDKSGNTPFAKALSVRDNEAGMAILNRESKAAEQVGGCGGVVRARQELGGSVRIRVRERATRVVPFGRDSLIIEDVTSTYMTSSPPPPVSCPFHLKISFIHT